MKFNLVKIVGYNGLEKKNGGKRMKKEIIQGKIRVMKMIISFSFLMATFGANTRCFGPLYQDKLPKDIQKLKKRM